MIDHNELIQEMEYIEKMPRMERIKLAGKRRKDQLIAHTKWMKTEDITNTNKHHSKNRKRIKFTADLELMDIAARNDLDEMKDLLKNGADPNETNHDGLTALHQCCIDGSLDMVTLLVKNGANVNIKDRDLWTPLHAAATCGHFKIVSFLIKAGADLTAINGDGDMPHDIAEDEVMQQYLENEIAKIGLTEKDINNIQNASHSHILADVNHVLISGGDLNQPLDQGGTFLHIAIANGYNDIVNLLLREGASVSVRDEDGWEPIHVAAYWGNEEALDLLANHDDIDIRSTTDNGETPYDLCEDHDVKLRILQIMGDVSQKYGSVKTYTTPYLLSSIHKESSFSGSDDEMTSHFDDSEETVTDTLTFIINEEQTISQKADNDNIYEIAGIDDEEIQETLQDNSPKDETSCTILNLEASEFSERRNSVKEAKHLAPIKRANSMERHQHHPRDTDKLHNGNENNIHETPTDNILDLLSTLNDPTSQGIISMDDDDDNDNDFESITAYPKGIANPLYVKANTQDDKQIHVTDGKQNYAITNHKPLPKSSNVQGLSETGQTASPVIKHSKPRAPIPLQEKRHQFAEISETENKPEVREDVPYLVRQNAASSLMTSGHHQQPTFTETNNNMFRKNTVSNKTTLIDLKKQRQAARMMQKVNLEADNKTTTTQSTFYNVSEIYDPPPSPTMIRYHFRMSEEEFHGKNFIREKKCILM
ncbi:protein phosphatase 1 regulatory inhibitor subunit 16B-like [Palaemon carinicauda]|uniref:protein phosphatase 1 regulatory inhibitor subunit 16B-like n=1 Tax=Palaemon carinicauda TaxID=392227 RepID=UPI0035B6475F